MARKRIVNAIAVRVLVSALSRPASTFASAGGRTEESVGAEFAYGAASALLNVVHVPLKAACGGPYIISPQQLWAQGESETRTEGPPWR